MNRAFAILVLSAILLSCAPQPADPTVAIENLKVTCNAACAGSQVATVTVPAGWSLASTADGICLKKETRLLCGTCSCGTYGLTEGELVATGDERVVTCTFTGDADERTLVANCS